jgi:hypothetical protein
MTGITCVLAGGQAYLDVQTVTNGQVGTVDERVRGFISGGIGSISDGTSNIYAGAPITHAYWYAGGGFTPTYTLTITGATNTGWTNLSVNGVDLARASATFASGTWTWSLPGSVIGNFGANGGQIALVFT